MGICRGWIKSRFRLMSNEQSSKNVKQCNKQVWGETVILATIFFKKPVYMKLSARASKKLSCGITKKTSFFRGCSYGRELARLGGLARLGEIPPSLRNSYKNIMCSHEK